MKVVTPSIIIVLLLFACSPNPSHKQIEFANNLLENPIVLSTEWGTSLSLDVTVDLNALGINPEMQAQLLADNLAAEGVKFTDRNVCINIYYGNSNFLAESCLNK